MIPYMETQTLLELDATTSLHHSGKDTWREARFLILKITNLQIVFFIFSVIIG